MLIATHNELEIRTKTGLAHAVQTSKPVRVLADRDGKS